MSDEYAREHREAVDRLMGLVARLDASFTAPGSTDKGGAWDPFDDTGLAAAAVAARGGAFSSVVARIRGLPGRRVIYVALRAVVRIQRGFRARHLRRRTQRRSEMGPLPAIRETSSMRDSSIRSMGDVEGDESRPDLSGDSSGARLSLSAAAERIASSLSGGYQEYKE